MGAAWMVGALRAIEAETGWDPVDADHFLGTSAGALLSALLAAGIGPGEIAEQARAENEVMGGAGSLRPHWSFPRPVLASPALALRSMREPWRYGPAGIIAWLPRGVMSTRPLQDFIRARLRRRRPARPPWLVAVDYDSGERVAFGMPGAPRASVPAAVAASCAVPGLYFPVTIGGRRYIDGGLYSPSNLDLLLGTGIEVVVCLNPMSSRFKGGFFEPTGPLAELVRGSPSARLAEETEALREAGMEVLTLQPRAEDVRVMGYNYMSPFAADKVASVAFESTRRALAATRVGARLRELRRPAAAA